MPDQPDDPINYDMKIPPERKENKIEPQRQRSSGETPGEPIPAQLQHENEKPAAPLPPKDGPTGIA